MARVFVSATSHDLKSYRQRVAAWAETRGYDVVVQDDFATQADHQTVARMLAEKIEPCDAVIHLAGLAYGFAPRGRPAGSPPRSYTQLEYEVAQTLRKTVVRFVARESYAPDEPIAQTDEERDLQLAHRTRLTAGDEPFHHFTTAEDLQALLDNLPELQAIRPSRAKPQNLPFARLGSLFKGRDDFLARLRESLVARPTHVAAVTAKQAVHGLGGVGKTRAAVEYGWKHEGEYSALLFVTADSTLNLERNLAGLCGALVLDLPEQSAQEQAVRCAAAVDWLRRHSRWFLVLDNVDTPDAKDAVERLLQNVEGGHVVLTSRLADWGNGVEALELDVLTEAASVEFLLERTENKRQVAPTDAEDARALAADLGGLALALEQAGAFVARHRVFLAEYHARWRQQEAKVLEWYDASAMKYPKSVAVTWQTTVERLGPDARHLLNVLCWLAPDAIPRALIEKLTAEAGEPPVDVETAVGDLAAYSLAKFTPANDAIVVHRLEAVMHFRLPVQ